MGVARRRRRVRRRAEAAERDQFGRGVRPERRARGPAAARAPTRTRSAHARRSAHQPRTRTPRASVPTLPVRRAPHAHGDPQRAVAAQRARTARARAPSAAADDAAPPATSERVAVRKLATPRIRALTVARQRLVGAQRDRQPWRRRTLRMPGDARRERARAGCPCRAGCARRRRRGGARRRRAVDEPVDRPGERDDEDAPARVLAERAQLRHRTARRRRRSPGSRGRPSAAARAQKSP